MSKLINLDDLARFKQNLDVILATKLDKADDKGHAIFDKDDLVAQPQEPNLRIIGGTITDDNVNEETVVTIDISSLNDTLIGTLVDGQILKYVVDPSTHEGKWKNITPAAIREGHIIKDSLATLTQRDTLQILGATVDDYNNETRVNISLDSLTDTDLTNLSNGKILRYVVTSGVGKWVVSEDIDTDAIADMTDVDLTSIGDGKFLKWDATASKWVPATVQDITTLAGLDDTNISSPVENDVLSYDDTNDKWVNRSVNFGHEVKDDQSLTTITQRDVLEFAGASVSDDPTAGAEKTKVTIGINTLNDTVISAHPSSGEVLQYNGTNWINTTLPVGTDGHAIHDSNDTALTQRGVLKISGAAVTDNDVALQTEVNISLENLSDTNVTSVQNNQILKYDDTTSKWIPADDIDTDKLEDLLDTNIDDGTLVDGQVLKYDGIHEVWVNGEDNDTNTLELLLDTDIDENTLNNNQKLCFDVIKEKWVNRDCLNGHAIQKEDGTTLSQRDNLQFIGANVTDDNTNNANKTVVTVDVDSLANTNINNVSNGDILKYNSTTSKWENTSETDVDALANLTDVNLTSLADGQILKYDNTTSKWINTNENPGVTTLAGLTDTDINTLTDGQFLVYDATDGKWENTTKILGHTIKDGTGVSLAQRTNLQFVGATVEDVNSSGENITKVTIPTSAPLALDDLTDVNVAGAPDGDVLKKVSGVWTYQTLGSAAALDVPVSGDAASGEVVIGDDSRLTDARTPVSHTHTMSEITDLPTLGSAAEKDVPTSGDASATEVVMGDDSRLSDARTPIVHTHTMSEVTDLPTLGSAAEKDVPTSGDAATTEVVMGNDSRLTDARTPVAHTHTKSEITDLSVGGVLTISRNSTALTPTYDGTSNQTIDIVVPTTAADVNAIPTTEKGTIDGVATLGSDGIVPSAQLPASIGNIGTAYNHATDASRLTTATASGLYKVASTAEGHIASLTTVEKADITALGIPGTDTDRYVNSASFVDDTTTTPASPVKMTLTRAGSDSATVDGYIPKVSSTSAGVAPKGATVSTQDQTTKFLREDGSWQAPSYTDISGLDAASVGGNNKYIKEISETDGIISATAGDVDTAVTQSSTNLITSGAVWTAIDNLPEPMVFRGSLGVGGTITALPVDGSAKVGDTYKVITDGTYDSQAAVIGDTFICDSKTVSANTWTYIPSGDDPSGSGTVTSVKIEATSPIVVDDDSAITTSGVRVLSHADSGATAGSYGDSAAQTPSYGDTFKVPYITVDAKGHVTGISDHNVTIPASDNTDNYVNSGAFNYDTTHDDIELTLGRTGSLGNVTFTNHIPKVSDSTAGIVPKGNTVSTQSASTKFLREDGNWATPSYTVNTNTTYDLTSSGENIRLSGSDNTNDDVALSTLINGLSTGSSDPQDADYFISQYAGGGTTTTTYHRRPISTLWNYIKSKLGINTTSGDPSKLLNEKGNYTQITGTYSATGTAPISGTGVAAALATLDGTVTGTAAASKTLTAFSETDGKVSATFGDISITKSQVSDFTHTHVSSDITAMTGYTKASDAGAIETTDTLNEAIGKLEKTVDGKTSNTGTVTSVAAGTGLSGGTITTSGTLSVSFGTTAGTACQGNDSRLSDSRTPTSHTHGNIQNGGTLQTNDITIANGDKLIVTDSSDSNKVARTSIAFDGSTATKALTQKGTFETFATSNTTYTFAGGTNKFTVTPSGGTALDVTVTPSITNNITGSGTSGYIAKFNGANTITNGPAFGSDTSKFLRNDGQWGTVSASIPVNPSSTTGLTMWIET